MIGVVEGIYVTGKGSAAMQRVEEVRTIEGCGIEGDRYCEGTGYWTPYGDVCEVTLISAEDLDHIENELGIRVRNGEHRRNIVTRGIGLKALHRGERFLVGEVVFEYRGPRSVCQHVERLTEPGMTQALKGRGGICAIVAKNGTVRAGDEIEVL